MQRLERDVGTHGHAAHRAHASIGALRHRAHAPAAWLALEPRIADAGHGEGGLPVGIAVEDVEMDGVGHAPKRQATFPSNQGPPRTEAGFTATGTHSACMSARLAVKPTGGSLLCSGDPPWRRSARPLQEPDLLQCTMLAAARRPRSPFPCP